MKNKKLVSMVVSLSLVGLIGVGSTMAYLSSITATITNTFTVGSNVAITLHETSNGTNGGTAGEETTTGNEYTGMMPGVNEMKDPTVVVTANSSETYVYMEVKGLDANDLVGLEIDGIDSNWTKVGTDKTLDGIYVYNTKVASATTPTELAPLFNTIGLANTVNEEVKVIDITVRAAAIQSAGFENEAAARAEAVKLFTGK